MTTIMEHAPTRLVATWPPRPTEFLRQWFAGCPADHLIERRDIHARTKAVRQTFYALDAAEQLYGDACRLVEDHDCYFGVCPRLRPQGRNEDVTHAPGFWADLDFKRFADGEAEALRRLADFPIRPTWIIATGGGFHLYWKLTQVVRWDASMAGRLKGIVHMLDADPAATDRARVLRVPGTFNHKYPDCQVRIVSWPTD
jgi:hypothetical protein